MMEQITEARPLAASVGEAATRDGHTVLPITLITPGWGSSGYYSPQVLEAAASDRVWPAGTHMYLDHPDAWEAEIRPERSVRDLAGVLQEDAMWDGAGLVGSAKIFDTYAPMFKDRTFMENIGVSIRATATSTRGEAEGRPGVIVSRLEEGLSVDFVTRAGRGGRILTELMESARPEQVVARAIVHGVAEVTANDTREAVQQALKALYGGEQSWVWVRDFDESTVWFEYETPDEEGTYAQPYSLNSDGTATLSGDRVPVTARTEYVPVGESDQPAGDEPDQEEEENGDAPEGGVDTDPAGAPADAAEAANPSEEDTMSETPGAGSATNPRQVLEARLNAQTREIAEMRAERQAERVVDEVLSGGMLTPGQKARVRSAVLRHVPLTESLELDVDKVRAAATEAMESAEAEAGEILTAAGVGSVRGLGGMFDTMSPAASEANTSKLADSLSSVFGLSESAAQTAAKGR